MTPVAEVVHSLAWYKDLRWRLIKAGYGSEIGWAMTVKPVEYPDDFWAEYCWVVLNSGMKEQIARQIWMRVRPVVEAGGSASSVFGHKGKAAAIDRCWKMRETWCNHFRSLTDDDSRMVYLESLPWIGPITVWHLAKNYGMDVAKPDRHLVRIAGAEGVHELCARLARESGDRIATVDLVIWRAANLQWI